MRAREEFQYNPLDFEEDVAIGLTLPLTNDAVAAIKYDTVATASGIGATSLTNSMGLHESTKKPTGDFNLSYTTLEQARSNIRNLVLTNRGERVMHPEFGCDIYASLFENLTPSIIINMKRRIKKQCSIWLDYINVLEVDIRKTTADENRINIAIWFALYNDTINKEMVTINNIGAL